MANTETDSDWKPCPSGMLTTTAVRTSNMRRRQRLIRSGFSALVGTLAVVVLALFALNVNRNVECREVDGMLPAYVSGKLNVEDRAKVEEHLVSCEFCHKKLTQMKTGGMVASNFLSSGGGKSRNNLSLGSIHSLPLAINRRCQLPNISENHTFTLTTDQPIGFHLPKHDSHGLAGRSDQVGQFLMR